MGPIAALNVDWADSVLTETPYALYFFRERQYIRWDIDNERPFDNYPRNISDINGWPGLMELFPGSRLSGAMHVPGWNNRIYFFFRDQSQVATWDVANHCLDPELMDIAQLLPSTLTEGAPFAPLYVDKGDSQFVYALRGDTYTRFTVKSGELPEHEDHGYPRKIGDGWTDGLTVAPTCAVSVRWTQRDPSISSHKLYFFLGDLYTRWDITSHSKNYRLDVPSGWEGWPEFD